MTNWVVAAYASVLPVLAIFAAFACVLTYLYERCVGVCARTHVQYVLLFTMDTYVTPHSG